MAAEFFQAITVGKNAIDGLRTLYQYAEEVKDVQKRGEFMKIIGESSLELAETQLKLAEKVRENDSLKETIDSLQKEIERLKNPDIRLIIRNDLYYTTGGDDGPFCTACYDTKKQAIRLSKMSSVMSPLGKYKCPVCEAVYA